MHHQWILSQELTYSGISYVLNVDTGKSSLDCSLNPTFRTVTYTRVL